MSRGPKASKRSARKPAAKPAKGGKKKTSNKRAATPPSKARAATNKVKRTPRQAAISRARPPTPAEGPFSGSHVYLSTLEAPTAVRAFARLLVDETVASGEPASAVRVSYDIMTPDGGIDAEVQLTKPSKNGLLFPGKNHFQIKTGDYPTGPASLRKLLYTGGGRGALHPRVKECLDANGTLTVALFGVDKPDPKFSEQLTKALKGELTKKHPEYADRRVIVLKKQQIGSLIDLYPPIFISIVPTPLEGLESFDLWGDEYEMKRPYAPDAGHQAAVIEPLRDALRDRARARHIRITGQAGVGKTRTVREALAGDEFGPLVVYARSGHAIRSHPIINHIRQSSAPFPIILVVDECPLDLAVSIWNQLQGAGGLLKLVTIYHESETRRGEGYSHVDMPAPSTETTKAILATHGMTEPFLGAYAEQCAGSPRIAHSVGENWQGDEGPLTDLATVDVFGPFVDRPDPPNSEAAKLRRKILEFLALFKEFGWKGESAGEFEEILEFIRSEEPGITRGTLSETIQNFQARKVLQGDYILYITPAALHVYMWVRWWQRYGSTSLNVAALSKLSPALRRAYMHMWEYAAESPATSKIARGLLEDRELFKNIQSLESEMGGTFFRALARSDPATAIGTLERIIAERSREELLELKNGRRAVIDTLESIAIEPNLFERAASLLKALALAENERWTNNATGVFADLFSYAPGQVAPTGAPPATRLRVLRETILSPDAETKRLGMRALERALRADHFVRMVGPERRGLRVASPGWMPRTYKEWSEAYHDTWQLALEAIHTSRHTEAEEVVKTLGSSARGLLARFPWTEPWVRQGLQQAAQLNDETRKIILDDVLHIIHFDGKDMPPEMRQEWIQLRDQLTGSTFRDRVLRYVRMDVFIDHFDAEGKRADQAEVPIRQLAQEAAQDFSILEPELGTIMNAEASNTFRFGREYGLLDKGTHLSELWQSYERSPNPKIPFLAGYYSALREKDGELWENSLDKVAASPIRRKHLAELSRHRDITPRAVDRILTAIEQGNVGANAFNNIWLDRLDDTTIRQSLERLYATGSLDAAATVVVALHRLHRMRDKNEPPRPFPTRLALEALKRASRKPQSDDNNTRVMDEYYWKEVALHVLDAGPPESNELGVFMLELFGTPNSVLDTSFDQAAEAAREWIAADPAKAWPFIATRLLKKEGSSLAWFLRESDSKHEQMPVIDRLPVNDILAWVAEDPAQRAWIAAEIAHVDLAPGALAYELLDRYADRKEVRRALAANWHTGGFVGSEILYHERRKTKLLEWRKAATSPGVLRWIDDEIKTTDRDIQGAAEREERLYRR